MATDGAEALGGSHTSALIQLAVAYSDALDRCTQSGGANIDELMAMFAEDAVWTAPTSGRSATSTGKAAIRDMYLSRTARLQQQVELIGVEAWGDLVVCRLQRRATDFAQAAPVRNVRVLLVKDGKIKQVTVLVDPDEQARARS